MPGFQVGLVTGWESDAVRALLTNKKYAPSLGDILYTTEVRENGYTRTVLMEIVGFEGGLPPYASTPMYQTQSQYYLAQQEVIAKARLFIEIVKTSSGKYLSKASRPPSLLSPVYLLKVGDGESEEIMRDITRHVSAEGIPVALLRSGIAHSEIQARERHFENAYFRLNLRRLVPKHILIAGQTGSGKTSSLMGLLLKYALETDEPIGWLIIDRHGEYTPKEGYVEDKFIGLLVRAVASNHRINDRVAIKTFRLAYSTSGTDKLSTYRPLFDIVEAPICASSITLADFASLEGVEPERAAELEEFILTIMPVLSKMTERTDTADGVILHTSFTQGDTPDLATANVLALVPLLVDNVIRYEGIGLSRDRKRGLHRVLVDRGVDARVSRILRKLILIKLGWRTRPQRLGDHVIHVLDDSRSVVKVSSTIKNPEELSCFLKKFMDAFKKVYSGVEVNYSDYPWNKLCKSEKVIEVKKEDGMDLDVVVKHVSDGNVDILDVSGVDNAQADLIALTVARRLFEFRFEKGVEESSRLPVVGIVSEEAPLYLSREKVLTPFNPFARIAREGRKFGLGLIAITQMATMIEKQILANFNTMIILRTRSRSDLEFFADIGVPVETLPYLGDREAFLYTPDLPIKEPIPVYLPGWFENKKFVEDQEKSTLNRSAKIGRELAKLLGEEE
ncbi:MAG: DUF87 domain-containing protein [Desulfurococcaceae archaeon]